MKNYLSSLSPIHSSEEEQEPVFVENETGTAPYLSEKVRNTPAKGPEKSVISGDIVIDGSIKATCSLDIFGTVRGDVETNGSLLLAGNIEGNVKARELHFSKAHLKGNITADEQVVLEDESVIEGDIQTKDFILDGKLNGNVKASGSITLKNTAVLTGDIETSTLEVAKGAVVNGSISIKRQ